MTRLLKKDYQRIGQMGKGSDAPPTTQRWGREASKTHHAMKNGGRRGRTDQACCSSLRRTDTNLETPGSSMVTPKSESAISMVRLLWVITTNWEWSAI